MKQISSNVVWLQLVAVLISHSCQQQSEPCSGNSNNPCSWKDNEASPKHDEVRTDYPVGRRTVSLYWKLKKQTAAIGKQQHTTRAHEAGLSQINSDRFLTPKRTTTAEPPAHETNITISATEQRNREFSSNTSEQTTEARENWFASISSKTLLFVSSVPADLSRTDISPSYPDEGSLNINNSVNEPGNVDQICSSADARHFPVKFICDLFEQVEEYKLDNDETDFAINQLDHCTENTKRDSCLTQRFCSCDDECTIYNNCCYDAQPQSMEPSRRIEIEDKYIKSTCENIVNGQGWLLVSSCPSMVTNITLKQQCELQNSSDVMSLVPVYDQNLEISYKNSYCAECHGVKAELPFWNVYIERCSKYFHDSLYLEDDLMVNIQRLAQNRRCVLGTRPMESAKTMPCFEKYNDAYQCFDHQSRDFLIEQVDFNKLVLGQNFSFLSVNAENSFKQLLTISEHPSMNNAIHNYLEHECRKYSNSVIIRGRVFRNSMCGWCIYKQRKQCGNKLGQKSFLSFSALINFTAVFHETPKRTACKENEIFDCLNMDSKRRDQSLGEYERAKKSIQSADRSRRLGEMELRRKTTKIFKPMTDVQERSKKEIVEELRPIKESSLRMGSLPGSFGNRYSFQSTPDYVPTGIKTDVSDDTASTITTDSVASSEDGGKRDLLYEIYKDSEGRTFVGDTEVEMDDEDLIVGSNKYKITDGLRKLLLFDKPVDYTEQDFDNYGNILVQTHAMLRNNDARETRRKANRGYKWTKIVKPIWDMNKKFVESVTGKGVKTTFLPSDSDALSQRLRLLMASRRTGNKGLDNEIVDISDELLRQKVLNKNHYKRLMNELKD